MDDIWIDALDPGYAAARAGGAPGVRRRPDPGRPAGPTSARLRLRRVRSGTMLAGLAFAGIGVFASVGVHSLHLEQGSNTRTAAALRDQVQTLSGTDTRLETELDALQRQTMAARAEAAATAGAAGLTSRQLALLSGQVAATAVTGPGITVVIRNAPGSSGGSSSAVSDGLVTDRDLQAVVNALWSAGAEAITVGGERIGPLSTIREAGEAVLVDFHPVVSPYVVAAIGDGNQLQTGLADSTAGSLLHTISSAYGVGVSVEPAGSLSMAATPSAALHSVSALPVPTTGASPGGGAG